MRERAVIGAAGLIFRNAWHYRRRHAGLALGAAAATGILTASLIVGDSVRGSLRDLALRRLGRAEWAVESGQRRFRAALAGSVERTAGHDTAALLAVEGSVTASDSDLRAPRVRLIGADATFDRFAEIAPGFASLGDHEAFVNEPLARRLSIAVGDPLVLRFAVAGALPSDIPLAGEPESWTALRVVVAGVLDDDRLGRFSLRATQSAAPTVFLPRERLAERMNVPGRANVLLAATATADGTAAPDIHSLNAVLGSVRELDDHQLNLRPTPDGGVELRSSNIFLDAAAVRAADGSMSGARPILTYLANSIRANDRTCPYSFVAGLDGPPLEASLADDEIALNDWLADDLEARPGDSIELSFFVLDPDQRLVETSKTFRVRSVIPLAGAAADPTLMPDFPGIATAESCGDWTVGVPIDFSRVRPKDEEYWTAHRGTPKAFVSPSAARAMWGNRFGSATAVRWPAGTDANALGTRLLERLPPETAGLRFVAARDEALRAASGGVDFAGLFVGLGFFIIAAALILAALLFGLALQARGPETGLFRALGFRRRRILALLLGETALIAVPAALAGSGLGIGMAAGILRGLRTVWSGAIGDTALDLIFVPSTLAAGAAAGFAVAILTALLVLRRQTFQSIHLLQSSDVEPPPIPGRWGQWPFLAGAAGFACALGLRLAGGANAGPGVLLSAGALALAGGLAVTAGLLARAARFGGGDSPEPNVFGLRNWTRRPRRTMAAILMPAFGVYLVFAVGANRPRTDDPEDRASGSGGFAFYGETAVSLPRDPGTREGREALDLPVEALADARILTLRRRDGDDASCLNLNRVALPPILGIPIAALSDPPAFRFTRIDPRTDPARPWSCLALDPGPGAIPAVADESVAVWGLGKTIGDRIPAVSESGDPIDLVLTGLLADSVFQGNLLVADAALLEHFPSAELRVLMVDAPAAGREALRRAMEDRLGDAGLDLVPTRERLDSFLTVQRTYLDIFLAFGAIGLLIGAAGFGVVANRNLIERRREFALLLAIGFRRRRLLSGAALDHIALAVWGLAVGAAAALVSMPMGAVDASAAGAALVAVLAGMAAVAGLASLAAVRAALRGPLLDALRSE